MKEQAGDVENASCLLLEKIDKECDGERVDEVGEQVCATYCSTSSVRHVCFFVAVL